MDLLTHVLNHHNVPIHGRRCHRVQKHLLRMTDKNMAQMATQIGRGWIRMWDVAVLLGVTSCEHVLCLCFVENGVAVVVSGVADDGVARRPSSSCFP